MRFRDEERHPGIRIHAVGPIAGIGGLIFTVGILLLFLIGMPTVAKWFLLASIIGGLVAFAVLRVTGKSS
jgi:mannose/fructose/N-acetylgalactosamine-specific phosphotransferase system component IID